MISILPIPEKNLGEWKTIPIQECGEKLLSLGRLDKKLRLRVEPMYFNRNISGSISDAYLRESLVSKIEQALKLLPNNMELVLWDGWRPLATQQALFDMFKEQILSEEPNLPKEELIKRASVYVSLPSSDPTKPSPHNTGGAIDLTLAYRNGKLLDMGTDFDDFTKKAQTIFFEKEEDTLQKHEIVYRENRRLLYAVMTSVGFTNYPEEWWHFDYGNQFWASISGAPNAIYSNVEPPKEG